MMTPALKYTLGRVGLFVLCAVALLPVPLNLWVKLMVAVVVPSAMPQGSWIPADIASESQVRNCSTGSAWTTTRWSWASS